uniref:Uncharacterized protein n=1 Tax=Anguilla anguilla TaxID=7936 RepID=A0A0E9SR23_ANGAN
MGCLWFLDPGYPNPATCTMSQKLKGDVCGQDPRGGVHGILGCSFGFEGDVELAGWQSGCRKKGSRMRSCLGFPSQN